VVAELRLTDTDPEWMPPLGDMAGLLTCGSGFTVKLVAVCALSVMPALKALALTVALAVKVKGAEYTGELVLISVPLVL
jgi:hypothetical protein